MPEPCNSKEGLDMLQRILLNEKGHHSNWVCKGVELTYFRYRGLCTETQNCPVVYLGRVQFEGEVPVQVRQFGMHSHGMHQEEGESSQQRGQNIFNDKANAAAAAYSAAELEACTAAGLRKALTAAQIPATDWPEPGAIKNWVNRENRNKRRRTGNDPSPAAAPTVVSQTSLLQRSLDSIQDIMLCADPQELWVLPGAVLKSRGVADTGRGYVPFTCRGMIATIAAMPVDEPFILGVDAKVGQTLKAWRTATVGLFVKGELRRTTLKRDSEKNTLLGQAYTTSYQPILQARMHQETKENYVSLLNDFIALVALVLCVSELTVVQRIQQIAKDFSHAIEGARLEVCPNARPVGDPPHLFANLGLQLPKKSVTPDYGKIAEGLRLFGYHCPNVDILDILIRYFLPMCRDELGEAVAVEYLQKERYVASVERELLHLWHIPTISQRTSFAFCTTWQGAFSVFPGSSIAFKKVSWENNFGRLQAVRSNLLPICCLLS